MEKLTYYILIAFAGLLLSYFIVNIILHLFFNESMDVDKIITPFLISLIVVMFYKEIVE